jgi:hypothetical protein
MGALIQGCSFFPRCTVDKAKRYIICTIQDETYHVIMDQWCITDISN